jgi:uncharacterized membrane protein
MAALTFISTSILAFPVAFTNGYIHLGDGFVMSCGVILGKRNGALAAGIGSALADIYLGYASWALPTFIIKALMAYLVGYIYEDLTNKGKIYKLITAFSVIWISFMLIVGKIISTHTNVANSSEALLTDGLITDIAELGSRTNFTTNAIIIGFITLPVIYFIIYFLVKNNDDLAIFLNKFITFLTAGTLTIILYYISASIMYGNWTVPIFSVPSNLLQYIVGIIIATALLPLTTRVQRQLRG